MLSFAVHLKCVEVELGSGDNQPRPVLPSKSEIMLLNADVLGRQSGQLLKY